MGFRLTVGTYPTGEVGELFVNADHANSMLDAFIGDAAIITSIALQQGVALETIRHAIKRDGRGNAASPIGAALDVIAEAAR